MQKATENQSVLLRLLANALFRAQADIPPETDWIGVLREARQQAVLPLACQTLREELQIALPDAWADWNDKILINNLYLELDHIELHHCMQEAKIPYVIMKGSASAAYYPQPVLRTMGDVDFLVRREDVGRAGNALKTLGFRETDERDNPIHQAFAREGDPTHLSEWELHWQPNGIPRNEVGEKLRAMLSDSVETARLHETENGSYFVPDDFHHGRMILIHTAMHLVHSGVGLRHLCDWAAFVSHFSEEAFRTLFEEKLRDVGLWEFAAALTAVSVRYLGCPDPRWPGEQDPELLEALLCDVIGGGNFGKKDSQRLNQAKLLVNSSDGTVQRGIGLRNLISVMNVKAGRCLPAAKRYPVLLPLAGSPRGCGISGASRRAAAPRSASAKW